MWLVSKFEGKLGDMPFTGRGTTGYDPAEKKYVGTWIDSVSPYMTIMKGDYDPATKTLTMTGDMRDVASGKVTETKQIWHYVDADNADVRNPNARRGRQAVQDDGDQVHASEIAAAGRISRKRGVRSVDCCSRA